MNDAQDDAESGENWDYDDRFDVVIPHDRPKESNWRFFRSVLFELSDTYWIMRIIGILIGAGFVSLMLYLSGLLDTS